jgi:hypothetical protein
VVVLCRRTDRILSKNSPRINRSGLRLRNTK